MAGKFKIFEQYVDYSPPVQVIGSVQLLMSHVPAEHMQGMRRVVLTNSASLLKTNKGKYDFYGK